MDDMKLDITEKQAWVVFTALFEYSKNPISQEHGEIAKEVAETIKERILKNISNVNSR